MDNPMERSVPPARANPAKGPDSTEQITETDARLIRKIRRITDRGNNAEVRKKKDGTFTVYEVKKNLV